MAEVQVPRNRRCRVRRYEYGTRHGDNPPHEWHGVTGTTEWMDGLFIGWEYCDGALTGNAIVECDNGQAGSFYTGDSITRLFEFADSGKEHES